MLNILNSSNMAAKFSSILTLPFLLIVGLSQPIFADDKPSMLVNCNASTQGVPDVQDKSFMNEVTLTGAQLSSEGKKSLGTIGHYEFWVETNLMSLMGKQQILDFVAKIEDKNTGVTYQAISGRHPINDERMIGKVSVVTYEADGITEKSAIVLDCLTHDVPSKPDLQTIPAQ